jgi:hypothetical protein
MHSGLAGHKDLGVLVEERSLLSSWSPEPLIRAMLRVVTVNIYVRHSHERVCATPIGLANRVRQQMTVKRRVN